MTDEPDNAFGTRLPLDAVPRQGGDGQVVLPLHEEEVTISRRRVETGVVKVATVTHTREASINEDLTHERVEIRTIPIGRIIESVPPVREEGGVTIFSVVEEIVVVEKRLILKEEVHLRRIQVTERHQESVILRAQEAVVTRASSGADRSE